MLSMLFVASVVYAERHEYSRPLMGMAFRIIVHSEDEAKAKRAAKAAFDRVAVLNQIMSDYEPESELSKLSNLAGSGEAAKISDELCSVLDRAQALAAQTGGAFDITAGASVQLWRRARRVKRLPPQYALAKALKTVGFRSLKLDANKCIAELTGSGTRLDLGGIAKGYALDEALAVLKKNGLRQALVSAGGDIVVGSCAARKRGLARGVDRPARGGQAGVSLVDERRCGHVGRFVPIPRGGPHALLAYRRSAYWHGAHGTAVGACSRPGCDHGGQPSHGNERAGAKQGIAPGYRRQACTALVWCFVAY